MTTYLPDPTETASVLKIKESVRERDGYQCRDCGMTREQHVEKYGRDLDVHRVLPGMIYHPDWCVTLCRSCHGPKPKRATQIIFGDDADTLLLVLSRYTDKHQRAANILQGHMEQHKFSQPEDALCELLVTLTAERAARDHLDASLTADGLW